MKVAYLTNCFGSQSHTFIRREIVALRAIGVELCLLGVRRDNAASAAEAAALVAETSYLYPIRAKEVAAHNLSYLRRAPVRYLVGAVRALTREEFGLRRRAKMLYHYLVATKHAAALEEQQVTHIHAHFMNVSASIAMYASYHSKIPFSVTVHSAGTYKTPHILGVAQKLTEAQFLIMISHHNVAYFDAIAACRSKCHVVRCGMQVEDFPLRPIESRRQDSPARLLAVGRFVEKKGFIYLVEAAALLRERGLHFELTLIGEGPLFEQVKRRREELGLTEQVVLAGRKETADVRAAMTLADVVIVPSVTSASGEKEGLPVVIMEAMATGVPVVASDHSGIPEIVRPGETGFLTAERDVHGIAQAIVAILQSDTGDLVRAARQLVEGEFNISAVAQRRRELFEQHHRAP